VGAREAERRPALAQRRRAGPGARAATAQAEGRWTSDWRQARRRGMRAPAQGPSGARRGAGRREASPSGLVAQRGQAGPGLRDAGGAQAARAGGGAARRRARAAAARRAGSLEWRAQERAKAGAGNRSSAGLSRSRRCEPGASGTAAARERHGLGDAGARVLESRYRCRSGTWAAPSVWRAGVGGVGRC
jgi:hypothetical protein